MSLADRQIYKAKQAAAVGLDLAFFVRLISGSCLGYTLKFNRLTSPTARTGQAGGAVEEFAANAAFSLLDCWLNRSRRRGGAWRGLRESRTV